MTAILKKLRILIAKYLLKKFPDIFIKDNVYYIGSYMTLPPASFR